MLSKIIRIFCPLFLLATFLSTARATIIDFEDAPAGVGLPAGYKGFTWSGGFGADSWMSAIDGVASDLTSQPDAFSGTHYVWSNGGTSLTMSNGLFDFNSVWVSGRSNLYITATGYLGGTMTHFNAQLLAPDTYTRLNLHFTGIDSVRFDYGANVRLDDIEVNVSQGTSVPDSGSSYILLGGGLLSLAWMRRKVRLV